MKKRLFCALCLLGALVLSACTAPEDARPKTVLVMLPETEGVTVLSENPVGVAPGGEARFAIRLADGYKIDSLEEGARLEDSAIVLEEVRYPHTVKLSASPLKSCRFTVFCDAKYAKVLTDASESTYPEGTEIDLALEETGAGFFLGYSRDKPLTMGGELLSGSRDYRFSLENDTMIYVNFSDESLTSLVYHANGGSFGGKDTLTVAFSDDFWLCPHAPVSDGSLSRDGYVLLGFSTEADGSGRYYGPGWNIDAGDGPAVELYAVWAKESAAEDFVFSVQDGEATVTGYSGRDATLVIPETAEGVPVKKIAAGAFAGCGFDTLVLSRNIRSIQPGAFSRCRALTTVYMPDSISNMTDLSFQDCGNISTAYFLATREPKFSYALMGTGSVKYQRLMLSSSPRLILVAGSSCLYGIDTDLLEEELGRRYTVVNYGNHANTPSAFFMELAASFTEEGDLVVTCTEPMIEQWGGTEFNTILWQIFECAYDAFSRVDLTHFSKVFSSFASFNRTSQRLPTLGYSYHLPGYGQNGDFAEFRPDNGDDHVTFANGSLSFSTALHTKAGADAYNAAAALIRAKGGEVLMSFSPANVNALESGSKQPAARSRYMKSAASLYDADIISDLENYIFPGRYFYDTDLHMTTGGARLRTGQLARDIRTWLEGGAE